MKYLRENDPRFQYLGLKVGGFLAVLLILLLVMAALLGWRQDFFQPTVAYYAKVGRADAIFPGMEVALRGIRVGRVADVRFDDTGIPEITMRVQERSAIWLRQDAVAWLKGLDPLGTPYIDLSPGDEAAPPLEPGTVLPFERESTLGELASAVEAQLRPVIEDAAKFVEELSRADGDIRQAVANIRELTTALAGEVPPMLGDLRQSAATSRAFLNDFTAEEGDLRQSTKHLAAISSELDERLPAMLGDLEKALASMRELTTELQNSAQAASPKVLALLEQSTETAAKAEELMTDLRRVWFIRMVLPRRPPEGTSQ